MKKSILILGFVALASVNAFAQNVILGRTIYDTVTPNFFSQNNNTTKIFDGLKANVGTNLLPATMISGGVPSAFTNFNGNQFGTNASGQVFIKPTAPLTNVFVSEASATNNPVTLYDATNRIAIAGASKVSTNILTTKGDIFVFNGTNLVRFPKGTNGQVISYDPTTATGLKVVDQSSGSSTAINPDSITTQTLSISNSLSFPTPEGDVQNLTLTHDGAGNLIATNNTGDASGLTIGSLTATEASWFSKQVNASLFSSSNSIIGVTENGGEFIRTNSNGSLVGGVVEDSGSVIQVQGEGSMAFGYATGGGFIGTIGASDALNGSYAFGMATDGGKIYTTYYGASVWGYATGAGSELKAGYVGAAVFGHADHGGVIQATGSGSFATGSVTATNSLIEVTGSGGYAHGWLSYSNSSISAGDGSHAFGVVPFPSGVISAGIGSIAFGYAGDVGPDVGSTISASGYGNFAGGAKNVSATGANACFAYGAEISNSNDSSFAVGYGSKQFSIDQTGLSINNSEIKVDGSNGITDTKDFTDADANNHHVVIKRGIITEWTITP